MGIVRVIMLSVLALSAGLAPHLAADVIYGTIRFAKGEGDATGMSFVVVCKGRQYGGSVQKLGSYKVYVDYQGSCTLKLFVRGPQSMPATADVNSYDEPVRYDFAIVGDQYGGYGLARQ